MIRISIAVWISAVLILMCFATASGQQKKIKVIADQDSGGPQGTNLLSLLMLLRTPQIDLLGITTISGDQWMEQATIFALWAAEQTGRTDVPIVKGAEMPLVNTPREQEARDALNGSYLGWHGSFNPNAPNARLTWAPPGGYPKRKPRPGRAADFSIDTIRANPGEVILLCAGPLTNIALAIRMDPEIVGLTKAIYIMGGSSRGGPKLNGWWDPEAAAITMRASWKEIVVSPFEAGAEIRSSQQLMRRVVQAGGLLASQVKSLYLDFTPPAGTSRWSMMWDELLVAALLDPSVLKKSATMYLAVDISHGPSDGHTMVWEKADDVPVFFCPTADPGGPIAGSGWDI
jgi:purine nucleosidase